MRIPPKWFLLSQPFCWIWQMASGQNCDFLERGLSDMTDTLVNQQMARQHIVGLSLGIIRNGEVVFMKGYGFADREYGIPAEVSTTYRFASLSKIVTTVAALKAWEEGLLNLQADVRVYVPEYPVKIQGPITVEQLLACEGGLQQYSQVNPYDLDALVKYIVEHPSDYDPVAAIDIFKNQPLLSRPGTQFNYSTFSFNLLAAVIERATGMPFEQYVAEKVTTPMDLPYFQPEYRAMRPYPGQSSWYRVEGDTAISDKLYGYDYEDVSWKLAGGGFTGSIVDLSGFARALLNGSLLRKDTRKMMFANRQVNGKSSWYGMGVFLSNRNGQPIVSQFGHQAGARSILYLSPETKDGVLILSNTYGTDLKPLAQDVWDLIQKAVVDSACSDPFPNKLIKPSWQKVPDSIAENASWLQWTASPSAATYQVEWSLQKNFKKGSHPLMTDSNRIYIQNLPMDTDIYFRVRAENKYLFGGLQSGWSETMTVHSGTALPAANLPYTMLFDQVTGIKTGNNALWSEPGITWSLNRCGNGLRWRGGRWSLAPLAGGWTIDVLPGFGHASGFLELSMNLENSSDSSLLFRLDYLMHGNNGDLPQIACWMRGDADDVWIALPKGLEAGDDGEVQHMECDIMEILQEHDQVPGQAFQVRFGFYGSNDPHSYQQQPALTLLSCIVE